MFERKSRAELSKQLTRQALAGTSIAACLFIAGCDAGSDAAARADTEKAARLAASAGQAHATPKLYDKVAGMSADDKKNPIDAASYKDYISQQSTAQDLAGASAVIKKALGATLASGLKSVVQAQDGNISLSLAGERLQIAQGKLNDLAHEAIVLQDVAHAAADLGAQADALTPYTKAPETTELDKAKASIGERDSAVTAAQAAVDAIEKDMAAKQNQAKGIFSSTEADFKAADALKGQASIDAANKAMDARKEADVLLSQAGAQEPALAKAKSDLQVAKLQQASTQQLINTLSRSLDAQRAQVKQTTETIATLREQAKKLVQDPNGVSEGYKKLLADAAALEADLKSALAASRDAETAFRGSVSELSTNQRELGEIVQTKEIDKNDALAKAVAEKRNVAALNWAVASAADTTGRINATGLTAAAILGTVDAQVAAAFKGAGLTSDMKSTFNAGEYKDEAQKAFTSAAAAAKTGTDLTTDTLKWLGYGLQASAQQGLSLVSDKREADAARTAAKNAGTEAVKGNPDVKADMQRLSVGI